MSSFLTSTGTGPPPGTPDPAEQDKGGPPPAGRTSPLRAGRWAYGVIAVVTYLPMLLTKPGVVSDDTKTYLYLDPGKWMRTSASAWDPNVALGTVTHETIGYLFPMGPYYWTMALIHVPTWVAQRLWLGSIVFVAGAGVLYLADTIGLVGPGRLIAAMAYAFTPYVLQYSGRISVILMPYAGLPLLLAFVIRAVRQRGWKYPALFALVVALVSGINASSILYVGIAPVLWLPFVVLVAGEATGRRAFGTFVRVGLLQPPRLAVVDRRPSRGGGVRHQRPPLHGVGPGHQFHLQRLRCHPGPGLLVLLRRGPHRAVDAGGGGAHPETVADRPHLRAPSGGLGVSGTGPLALPDLLRSAGGHRVGPVASVPTRTNTPPHSAPWPRRS